MLTSVFNKLKIKLRIFFEQLGASKLEVTILSNKPAENSFEYVLFLFYSVLILSNIIIRADMGDSPFIKVWKLSTKDWSDCRLLAIKLHSIWILKVDTQPCFGPVEQSATLNNTPNNIKTLAVWINIQIKKTLIFYFTNTRKELEH